jgi:hypothetical protein
MLELKSLRIGAKLAIAASIGVVIAAPMVVDFLSTVRAA